MSLKELMRVLKLTETAVRRHMQKLQLDGLVERFSKQQAQGRPINMYRLTDKASTNYFPTGYEELAARMLDTIYGTDGHKGMFDFLLSVNRHKIDSLNQQFGFLSLEDRIRGLVKFFSDAGYISDYRALPDGRYFLYHQNCAIFNLASKYRQLCFVELKLIEAVAGAKTTRQQYIFKKQPLCGYMIDPR